ncbi:protein toll-like [Pectinophora gossypiella]|uniref:protein toll-like n=1 Tax=Pectinophora gossypiella TaxID=13191 RepID=UPI00214E56E9|nr:protein toll-like [Pectinophora gossypiella]
MLIHFCIIMLVALPCVYTYEELKMDNSFAYGAFKTLWIEREIYYTSYETIFNSVNGTIQYNGDILILKCQGRYLITDVFPPFETTLSASHVIIECELPVTPLVGTFQALNINVTAIEMLKIQVRHRDPLPPGNYTPGLSIKSLCLDTVYVQDFLEHNPDFFVPLTNLTTLMIYGSRLMPLPETIKLEVLSVWHHSNIISWDTYCENLRELSIFDVSLEYIPEKWPEKCSQLASLQMRRLHGMETQRVINSGINASCAHLRSLYIKDCNQDEPPFVILNVAKDLLYLNMSVNRIEDNALVNFPLMRNLTHLDLQRNRLTGWGLFDLVKQLPSLRYLNLDGNLFVNLFCNYETRINSFTAHLQSLEWLSLRNMKMDLTCLKTAYFSKLRYLDLYLQEDLPSLTLELPQTNAKNLEVDLRGRHVGTINNIVNNYDYDKILKGTFWGTVPEYKTNVTIWLTSIDCDCNNILFIKAVRDGLLSFPELICNNSGIEVIHEPTENIDCKLIVAANGCSVRYFQREATARVVCHGGRKSDKSYPEYEEDHIHTVSINASNDEISSLRHMKLTEWLEVLDLRNNQIARLDANDSHRLFALPERRVWLSGNKIICDCDNKPLLDALHEHRHQVVDFDSIICFNTGMSLSSVTSYEVCQVGLRIAVAVNSVFALLILVAAVYLWRNRLRLKIYLYSRGLCLFCLREEDVDSDKPYDAFLSFAHGDMEYVNEVLLPQLEAEPYSYRVCVHYRDWPVGDWIPAQIMRSVSLSKRTIILLSRNFIASIWASLEFRYAVASATQENRMRLLVLILDDVLNETLDPEMQGYLNYNTYLTCDDPWFWEKLRYAMPHRKQLKRTKTSNVFTPNPMAEEILMASLTD